MKALVIGLGSMGKRRLRLLKEHFTDVETFGVDQKRERREFCRREWGIEVYNSLEDAFLKERFNCAFVCTSPLSHGGLIRKCLCHGLHVFSELNLVSDGYEENMKLAQQMDCTLFLSSTMLYRNEMRYLCQEMQKNTNPVSYTYHVGQYLPDWHPWESYHDFFIGESRTNGCREILAIELPWLIKAFGGIQSVYTVKRKLTGLHIDYKDCYMMILNHENGNIGMVMVDVVSREAVRSLKVIGEEVYYSWEGTPDSFIQKNMQRKELECIDLYDGLWENGKQNKTVLENPYKSEIEQFFSQIKGESTPVYGFKEDIRTLELIDEIESE